MLYVGESPFWAAMRAKHGDPRADLDAPGPQLVGRFDLAAEAWLPPLDVGAPGARAGVWDVHAAHGRVWFTTYFDAMGFVEPASGAVRRLPELGTGLNEIAPGPDGTLLVSRYAGRDGGPGSVVVIDSEGRLVAEHPLPATPGFAVAPKTPAFDPLRREIWLTSDLLPEAGGPARHDAFVLDASGQPLRRIEAPEVQFVAFGPDGRGARAELDGRRLDLVRRAAGGDWQRIPLDADFPTGLDFVQDLKLSPDGVAIATRWSGRVHRVDASGRVRTLALPRLDPDGLYYTAVPADGRICATYCADVSVVCTGG